jgi:hypothetical protein
MAVNTGLNDQKERLAELLENAAVQSINLGLWVEGRPFDVTLRRIVDQLLEQVDQPEPANVYSRRPHRDS